MCIRDRNKVLNMESKFNTDLGYLADQLKDKFKEHEDFDNRVRVSVAQNLQETATGQRVIEMVAQQLQGQGAGQEGLRNDLLAMGVQLQGTITQMSAWNHNQLQVEAEVTRLGKVVESWSQEETPWHSAGPTMGPPPGVDPWAATAARGAQAQGAPAPGAVPHAAPCPAEGTMPRCPCQGGFMPRFSERATTPVEGSHCPGCGHSPAGQQVPSGHFGPGGAEPPVYGPGGSAQQGWYLSLIHI